MAQQQKRNIPAMPGGRVLLDTDGDMSLADKYRVGH
ncbi:hypothetical protein CCACVL1_20290, partial [Corchorus capsularis]